MKKIISDTQIDEIGQLYFEFKDWKDCLNSWRDNLELYGEKNMQLVISTHPITSGYYIETRGKELTKGDHKYCGKKVFEQEKRVKAAIEKAKKNHTSPPLIL